MPALGQSDYDAGWVYIAASHTLGPGKYKIGLSRDPAMRLAQLNAEAYGGVTDWYMARYRPVSSMRAVEQILHESFGPPVPTESGSEVQEVFGVPFPKAENYLNMFAERFKPRYHVADPSF